MIHKANTSLFSKEEFKNSIKQKKSSINWHKAISCAIKIELIDFSPFLEFYEEYILGKNSYRINLLIIKKLTPQMIPINIARIFRDYNLFEIKGLGSTLGTDAYYKTVGYAGLFINQTGESNQLTANDVTLTFLCIRYPRKLIRHLTKERHLTVAKSSAGIYTIAKETFYSQIIVMKELPSEENLYLRSLIETRPDRHLQKQISDVCAKHKDNPLYKQYLNHFVKTATKNGGDTNMLLDPIFDEMDAIEKRTREEDKAYYQPQIDFLTDSCQQLTAQIQQLQNLLAQNNIPFNQGVNR